MADRALLHRKHFEEFKKFLAAQGWELLKPRGQWEVIRAMRDRHLFIVYDRTRGEHFSVTDPDQRIVRDFYTARQEPS